MKYWYNGVLPKNKTELRYFSNIIKEKFIKKPLVEREL
jgi:hypothetical protein